MRRMKWFQAFGWKTTLKKHPEPCVLRECPSQCSLHKDPEPLTFQEYTNQFRILLHYGNARNAVHSTKNVPHAENAIILLPEKLQSIQERTSAALSICPALFDALLLFVCIPLPALARSPDLLLPSTPQRLPLREALFRDFGLFVRRPANLMKFRAFLLETGML